MIYESKKGYDLFAEGYDKSLSFLDTFEQGVAVNMLGDIAGKEVLDLGCGTGRLFRRLDRKGAKVTGVDISEKMLEKAAKKLGSAKLVRGDVEELPFEDESFDAAVASFLIVHLKSLDSFFDEVYRVLKPGGVFVVTNINQKKAPMLKSKDKKKFVIRSHYHIPKHVIGALEKSLFVIERDEFMYEKNVWINQLVKAVKPQ